MSSSERIVRMYLIYTPTSCPWYVNTHTHTHPFTALDTFGHIFFNNPTRPPDYVNLYLTVVSFSKTVRNIINIPSACICLVFVALYHVRVKTVVIQSLCPCRTQAKTDSVYMQILVGLI